MSENVLTQSKSKSSVQADKAVMVQRKCACGQHTVAGGECEGCRKKRLALQRWDKGHPGPALPTAAAGVMTSRFGVNFTRTQLRAPQPMIQRIPRGEAGQMSDETAVQAAETAPTAVSEPAAPETTPAAPATEPSAPGETAAPGLLVADEAADLGEGQMRKSEFLAELKTAVCAAADAELAAAGRDTEGCPYLDYWFDYYGERDAAHIERALARYAPQARTATSAREYIPLVAERVRQGVARWVSTGEISGVPEGVPTAVPGAPPAASGPPVQAKARDGGARANDDPAVIRDQLGNGRPLDSGVRSRMEPAFGTSFSHVRMHDDSHAAHLSSNQNARAFTVGEHVAFAAGEYQPGTMLGDALIAHELAHVVQQSGATESVANMQMGDAGYDALERDADRSAVNVITSLHQGLKENSGAITQRALPNLRSGLRLSRCSESRKDKKLEVEILPVRIAEDNSSNPTSPSSFAKAQEIWRKCCIDISVRSSTTVAETDYQQLDIALSKTTEMTDLANEVSSGKSIPIFFASTFVSGGTNSKDHFGGGVGFFPPVSEIFTVEGVHPTVVAHELGHAMGIKPHGPAGTVMNPSAAHNVAVSENVNATICETARKFDDASIKNEECKVSP